MDRRARDIEQLYQERYVGFRNALAAVTGNRETARDAVQEAFARALQARDQYRGEAPLAAWVWKIAFRLALGSRSASVPVTEDAGVRFEPDSRARDLDPELVDALLRLTPRRRLVVFLRYFADFSYTEIGGAIGVAEGTVAATLNHAHRDLRAALEHPTAVPDRGGTT